MTYIIVSIFRSHQDTYSLNLSALNCVALINAWKCSAFDLLQADRSIGGVACGLSKGRRQVRQQFTVRPAVTVQYLCVSGCFVVLMHRARLSAAKE